MQIVNSIYPYPVLSLDDDDYIASSSFEVEFSLTSATSFKNANVHCKFKLHDQSLEDLIKRGLAGFYLHVENSRASYRHLYALDLGTDTFDLEIDPNL